MRSTKFLFLLLLPLALTARKRTPSFSIMIAPAGDADYAGRIIEDSFERGITLQCAELLKERLEEKSPNVTVTITRKSGEKIRSLQNANIANRLAVDLYVGLHFYHETALKPKMYLYSFSYNDMLFVPRNTLAFYHFDRAHLLNTGITSAWGNKIASALAQNNQYNFKGFFKLPCRPLIGITAPAFILEAGLKNKDDWQKYVEPIAVSLEAIIR